MNIKTTGPDHDVADALGIPAEQLKAEMDEVAAERLGVLLETDENGRPMLRPGYNLTDTDWREIWKGRDAKTAEEEKINLRELTVRYSEDGKRWYLVRTEKAVEELATTLRPPIQPGDEILAEEQMDRPYPYMQQAWGILIAGPRADWKTLGILRTLRQGIREATAQMMPIEFPKRGAGLKAIKDFLKTARVFDKIHHGEATF